MPFAVTLPVTLYHCIVEDQSLQELLPEFQEDQGFPHDLTESVLQPSQSYLFIIIEFIITFIFIHANGLVRHFTKLIFWTSLGFLCESRDLTILIKSIDLSFLYCFCITTCNCQVTIAFRILFLSHMQLSLDNMVELQSHD